MSSTLTLSASRIAEMVRAGRVTAREIVEERLAQIEATEPRVDAFLKVTREAALKRANGIDRAIADGADPGPLAGVPVAVKDLLCTEGVETTCASRILEGWVPPYTATAVTKLEAAGAISLGKLNMDEFAMGSSTENSAYKPTRNPWDLERVPGGSSGGSAAAVAARMSVVSLGSDTGGSIRQPASLCGIVGLKPTYGRVSRYGLVAFASSLDQVGPLATSVGDAALVYSVIAGYDPMDSTSIDEPVGDVTAALTAGVSGLNVGLVTELMGTAEPAVVDATERAVAALADAGAIVGEVSLPSFDYALSAYYLIAPAECSSNLARFDGVRYGSRIEGADATEMMRKTRSAGFGSEVKRRIMLGTYALSAGYYDAYYGQAQRVRTLVLRDFQRAFSDFDLLISPTSPTTAFRLGEKTGDPIAMYMSDLCTIPANLAGIPAISVPAGLDDQGLPVGVQLMAPALGEEGLFAGAAELERLLEFSSTPPLVGTGA